MGLRLTFVIMFMVRCSVGRAVTSKSVDSDSILATLQMEKYIWMGLISFCDKTNPLIYKIFAIVVIKKKAFYKTEIYNKTFDVYDVCDMNVKKSWTLW